VNTPCLSSLSMLMSLGWASGIIVSPSEEIGSDFRAVLNFPGSM